MSTRRTTQKSQGAAGNLARAPQVNVSTKGGNLRATTISFTNPGTIADSGNGLAIFPVGARIRVRNSPRNSRQFQVTASAAGSLTVTPAVVTSESAGANITITLED